MASNTATARPAFPRSPNPGACGLCGEVLIPGARPMTRLHASTGSVRCPPVTRVCSICSRDGLMPCSEPTCQIVGHPGSCLIQCSCCASWGCPAHVSPNDFLCVSCAGHGADFEHEGGVAVEGGRG